MLIVDSQRGGSEVIWRFGGIEHRSIRWQAMPAGGICLAAARVMRWIAFARALNALCSNSIAIDLDVKLGPVHTGWGPQAGSGGGGAETRFPLQCPSKFHKSHSNFILAIGPQLR